MFPPSSLHANSNAFLTLLILPSPLSSPLSSPTPSNTSVRRNASPYVSLHSSHIAFKSAKISSHVSSGTTDFKNTKPCVRKISAALSASRSFILFVIVSFPFFSSPRRSSTSTTLVALNVFSLASSLANVSTHSRCFPDSNLKYISNAAASETTPPNPPVSSSSSSSSSSSLNEASTTAVTCSLISRQTLSVFVRLLPPSLRGFHFLLLLKQSFDVAEEELLDKQNDDDDDAKIVVMPSERAREIV